MATAVQRLNVPSPGFTVWEIIPSSSIRLSFSYLDHQKKHQSAACENVAMLCAVGNGVCFTATMNLREFAAAAADPCSWQSFAPHFYRCVVGDGRRKEVSGKQGRWIERNI